MRATTRLAWKRSLAAIFSSTRLNGAYFRPTQIVPRRAARSGTRRSNERQIGAWIT
jgi:hypothetical protein